MGAGVAAARGGTGAAPVIAEAARKDQEMGAAVELMLQHMPEAKVVALGYAELRSLARYLVSTAASQLRLEDG